MPLRYADLNDISAARDFVIRRRSPTLIQLIALLIIITLLTIGIGVNALNKISMIALLCVLIASSGWYAIMQIQRSRDLTLATEFQNALFSSALGLNNMFCLIIKRDGSIIYLDRAFQQLFSDFLRQPRRSIADMLEYGRVSKEQSDKVFASIERGVYDKAVFDIRSDDGKFHKIVLSIEPIMRPSGFILLRGREYIERGAQTTSAPASVSSLLSKSNITLFSYVMDSMNMGVYMTDPEGGIIYLNPTLEQWLGFGEGEAAASNLSLRDIVPPGERASGAIAPDNFEGEVTFLKKAGGTMKTFVNQKLIRNEVGKVIGCTGLAHSAAWPSEDVKKKLLMS